MTSKVVPFYQDVDGFRLPGIFSAEVYKTGLKYKPQEGDFFVSTFPKCGTTWVQMIVSLLNNEGKPVKDYIEFTAQTPFLEMCGLEGIEKMKRPGSIKIHLPFHLTPYSPKAKYLYVVRNPKDALVSFYHHTRSNMYQFSDGNFNDYFEIFLKGETDFGDYFDNLLGWYEHKNDPNVMFITYEELKQDTPAMVKKIAQFMGEKYADLIKDEKVLADVLKYSSIEHMKGVFNDSFEAMSNNEPIPDVDPDNIPEGLKHIMKMLSELSQEGKTFKLIRKGIVGDWRANLTEDQNRRFNEKIEAKLKGTDVLAFWKSINCI